MRPEEGSLRLEPNAAAATGISAPEKKSELLKIYSENGIRSPGRLGAPRSPPSMLREQHAVPVEAVRNSVLTEGHPVSCCIDSNDRLSVLLLEIR